MGFVNLALVSKFMVCKVLYFKVQYNLRLRSPLNKNVLAKPCKERPALENGGVWCPAGKATFDTTCAMKCDNGYRRVGTGQGLVGCDEYGDWPAIRYHCSGTFCFNFIELYTFKECYNHPLFKLYFSCLIAIVSKCI